MSQCLQSVNHGSNLDACLIRYCSFARCSCTNLLPNVWMFGLAVLLHGDHTTRVRKDEGGRMKALGKGHWAGGCFTADLALGGQRLGGQVGQTRLVGQLAEVPVK